jgi:hypothetical protein
MVPVLATLFVSNKSNGMASEKLKFVLKTGESSHRAALLG